MDADTVIRAVAQEHKVVLHPGDPLLIMMTISDLHMKEMRKHMVAAVQEAADQMVAATAAQAEDAKGVAGRVITKSADYVGDRMKETLAAALADFKAAMAAEREAVAKERREVKFYVVAAFLSFALSAAIATGMFLAI